MKKSGKKLGIAGIALFLSMSMLVGCGSGGNQSAQPQSENKTENTAASSSQYTKENPVVIRVAHQLIPDSQLDKTFQKCKEVAEAKSDGRLKVEIYPSGQLYSEKEVPAQVQKGTLEVGMASASLWSGIAPAAGIFDVPYLFESYDQIHQAIDGEIGKIVTEELEKVGAKPIIYPDYGFVHMSINNIPSGDGTKPEDYKGAKIRVLGKMSATAVQAMGAAPVFMGGNEVYLALQKGTVDGAMTGLTTMAERKYYDVQDYIVFNKVSNLQFIAAISTKFYDSLPEDLQKVIDEAGVEAQNHSRTIFPEEEEKAIAELKANMKAVEIQDLTPWKALNKVAKEEYIKQVGETGQKLIEEAEKISGK